MTYKPFSIVVVPFPFTDKEHSKRRPALVISSIDHQKHTHNISLLMITSVQNSSWPNDYTITSLKDAGLKVPSVIRQKIFTLDSRLILKCSGKLSSADIQEVTQRLKEHLALKI